LSILHVLRAPVGGLFRHVVDLAAEQSARGHAVGVVADSTTGDAQSAAVLEELRAKLELGLTRIPMSREAGWRDVAATRHVAARARLCNADVLHGHGAKGGAYARLARSKSLRVYTPHGGSLHYSIRTPSGALYLTVERMLKPRTDVFLFESNYGLETYAAKIGQPSGLVRVVHNGVREEELTPIVPEGDAADFIYAGEMRRLKGVDVLLYALARLAAEGWNGRATLYGDGPERASFEGIAGDLGLTHQVHFHRPLPAHEIFRAGRVLVVPSRAESLPYIVLEAAAAAVPLVATRVGGIPEIFGPDAEALVPPDDSVALAAAMRAAFDDEITPRTQRLRARVAASFTVAAMTDQVLDAYGAGIARKPAGGAIHR
jgi:glycosyltransferase involved in cell wall biosynthesis